MKRDPEKIFGIHPAEAAYKLTLLSPRLFEAVKQFAIHGTYEETAKAMGTNSKVMNIYLFRIRQTLGVKKQFDLFRIYYAAQFLYLYQEDDDERTTGPAGGLDDRSGARKQTDGVD